MNKVNEYVYRSAKEFLAICELAEKQAVEITLFHYAYNANLAFSIELFLKSMNSQTKSKVIMEVGSATLSKDFTKCLVRDHKLSTLFDSLDSNVQRKLNESFAFHRCNISFGVLQDVLIELDSSFTQNRYSFEKAGLNAGNNPELLLWTARFFEEILNPKK
ncbi:hypothetical protein VCS12_14920 [Vibrio cholerae]|uniref:hypothetical protein n=1 Tax=Vibrio cholerae TaxID=666 RepID=UPI00084D36B3|nr:hypothetical protein [Vibrio cholerae]OEG76699.1 hypothetical protein VCS12_14920 [Vibrio cholerae]